MKPIKPTTTLTAHSLCSVVFATAVAFISGCDSAALTDSDETGSGGQDQTSAGTGTDSLTPDTEELLGDDLWIEAAQDFEAFVKPPGFGAAVDPEDYINLGTWDPVFDWPLIATGAANLPDGRVVAWSSRGVNAYSGSQTYTHGTIFNPLDASFTPTNNTTHNMFCAGISMLPEGQVFLAGGGKVVDTVSIFENEQFSEIEPMNTTRWYPTSTTLPSGQVFTSLGTKNNPIPELWTDGEGWNYMDNVNLQPIVDGTNDNFDDWFPSLNVAPDGSLFHPGHMPDLVSIYMDQDDPLVMHGKRGGDEPSRLYGTTVIYDTGKMMIAGGGDDEESTNTALTIDLNGATPIVTPISSMTHTRSMQNSVVLPTGEVLVIGGNSSGIQFSDEGTVLEPEMWNPVTEQWRLLAPHDRPRNYHSTAILLKDGRVLAAGGGLCNSCATNHQNGEIYNPPYLFKADGTPADRPAITGGADIANPGDTIELSGTNDIVKFNMLRLVAITHHHSTDQRLVPIDSVATSNGKYNLTLNWNPNVLLPGYYWIFGLDQNGTPTEGHTIKINVVAPDTVTPLVSPELNNIAYEYYETDPSRSLPDFDSLTPVKTGTLSTYSLNVAERDDYFALRYRSSITVPEDGEYTFYLRSDDGSKLFIDGQLVVSNDGVHDDELTKLGKVTLSAGQHNIEVQHMERLRHQSLLVEWQGPGFAKTAITGADMSGEWIPTTIAYEYYETDPITQLPDFDSLTPVKTGVLSTYSLDVKEREEHFAIRYRSSITIPENGEYTFYLKSDDGSNLYINGQLIVTNDGVHNERLTKSGTVTLEAGQHNIEVQLMEHTRFEYLAVSWKGPGFAITPLTGADMSGEWLPPGVAYEYYEIDPISVLPDFDTLTPVKTGIQSDFSVEGAERVDDFAFRFRSSISVPVAGSYTFYVNSDDGLQLLIDGQVIVNNDGKHSTRRTRSGIVQLTAGQHDIEVQYFEATIDQGLLVRWKGPTFSIREVVASDLSAR